MHESQFPRPPNTGRAAAVYLVLAVLASFGAQLTRVDSPPTARRIASPPMGAPSDRRQWTDAMKSLQPGATLGEIVKWVEEHRPPRPHLDRDRWRMTSTTGSSSSFFALDEDWTMIVTADEPKPFSTHGDAIGLAASKIEILGIADYSDKIPEDLFAAVRAIARSPDTNESFDPVRLIQAVNELQPLGKAKALEALKAYDRIAARLQRPFPLSDHRIFWITQVLFVSATGEPGMPTPMLGAPNTPVPKDLKAWPLFPMVLQDDIPFLLTSGYSLAGLPESPEMRLEYCLHHCNIRPNPLVPTASPAIAADRVLHSPTFGSNQSAGFSFSNWENTRDRICVQAMRATEAVVPLIPDLRVDSTWHYYHWGRSQDQFTKDWAAFCEQSDAAEIHWSQQREDFAAK